jgi:MFS family permease
LQLLGVLGASISDRSYPALLATQGVAQGLGNGLQFCPAMAVLSTYFEGRRSLAMGLAASGASVGGVVYPLLVRQLLPRLGFGWTLRVLALVMAAVGATAAAFLRPRVPPRKAGPLVEWAAFTEPPYALFCVGCWLVFFALFFAFYYVRASTPSPTLRFLSRVRQTRPLAPPPKPWLTRRCSR